MLDIIDLDYDFPDRRLLQGVQFTVRPGALLHLRGGNGAGKTTLLKLLAGVLQPAHGDIRYRGDSINKDLAHYQQQICYVGHKTGVNQLLTVREHCRFELHRGRSEMSFNQLMMSCALVGLEEVSCGLLSEGLRRRVGLLRLLMSNASLDQLRICIRLGWGNIAKNGWK